MKHNFLNTWIFHCNPKRFNIDTYLKESSFFIYFRSKQRSQEVKIGDEVYIWRSASINNNSSRGIVCFGTIIEAPKTIDKLNYPNTLRNELWYEQSSASNDKSNLLYVGIKLNDIRLSKEEGMLSSDLLMKHEYIKDQRFKNSNFQHTNNLICQGDASILRQLWMGYSELFHYDDFEQLYKEGNEKLIIHLSKERNKKLIFDAKAYFKQKHGKLFCELCNFCFEDRYAELGKDYIEAHHIKPISKIQTEEEISIKDLMMLCANCHRMAHRSNGWNELKRLFKI